MNIVYKADKKVESIVKGDILQGVSSGDYYLVIDAMNGLALICLSDNTTNYARYNSEDLLRAVKGKTYKLVANTKSLTLDLSEGYK